jgi:phage baseplate assembly protein W
MADLEFLRVREYKDMSLTMARNPVTSDIVSVTGTEAVKRSLKNLINTVAGEVPFFPNFGSTVHELLFEPMDPITVTSLESSIRSTIEAYEPRVELVSVVVTPDEDNLQYQVDITIRLVNMLTPITVSLFLKRLR